MCIACVASVFHCVVLPSLRPQINHIRKRKKARKIEIQEFDNKGLFYSPALKVVLRHSLFFFLKIKVKYVLFIYSLAMTDSSGNYLFNGNYRIVNSKDVPAAGTIVEYKREYGSPEKVYVKGPLTEPLHAVVRV